MEKLQAYERRGKVGICFYGEDDSEPETWTEKVVIHRNRGMQRTRLERMQESARLLRLGVYEDCPDDCNCGTCNGLDDEVILN